MFKKLFQLVNNVYENDESELINQPTIEYDKMSTTFHKKKTTPSTIEPYGYVYEEDPSDTELVQNDELNTLPSQYPGKFKREATDIDIKLQSNDDLLHDIQAMTDRLQVQTKNLKKIEDLVDLYDDGKDEELEGDEKYKELRKSYETELRRMNDLYESYYTLFRRYIELKKNIKSASVDGIKSDLVKLLGSQEKTNTKELSEKLLTSIKTIQVKHELEKKEMVELHKKEMDELKELHKQEIEELRKRLASS
ncbi:hypothetical protein G210_2965 [Candida maltosa Xu316]|uniref:Spindle pole body component Bbp1 C-terminal domain-containing protein n=1 Tax=Candida maltosa (strain Xu316) TaxID=1245528 RepID=M3IK38_CANMX|nr:hypothetical protein G210_2965 [Candida maltosa Xu316]